VSDIDIVLVDRLKALDPKRPIREADMLSYCVMRAASAIAGKKKRPPKVAV